MSKRRKKAKKSRQANLLLREATKQFAKGKTSVTLKLPNKSKEFFGNLQETAYDNYCYTVKKKLFNRVQIINGIVYKHPF